MEMSCAWNTHDVFSHDDAKNETINNFLFKIIENDHKTEHWKYKLNATQSVNDEVDIRKHFSLGTVVGKCLDTENIS